MSCWRDDKLNPTTQSSPVASRWSDHLCPRPNIHQRSRVRPRVGGHLGLNHDSSLHWEAYVEKLKKCLELWLDEEHRFTEKTFNLRALCLDSPGNQGQVSPCWEKRWQKRTECQATGQVRLDRRQTQDHYLEIMTRAMYKNLVFQVSHEYQP